MTSNLSMLKADERALAKRYRLIDYFKRNENYLLFIVEMRKIIDKRFKGFIEAEWAKNKCIDLTQAFLERNDQLFDYVNKVHAASSSGFQNISTRDWERVCNVGSKIVVYMGWEYETKE